MYYAKYFFITSVLGFIIESFVYGNFGGKSGILYGPWTIVYGFGTILILLVDKIVSKKINNKILKAFLIFIICMLILTILELTGGILIEKIFNVVYWDYSNCKFNIGKYICLEMALLWGVASLAFVYIFKPIVDKILKYIPNFLIYILIVLMICDFILTILFKKL